MNMSPITKLKHRHTAVETLSLARAIYDYTVNVAPRIAFYGKVDGLFALRAHLGLPFNEYTEGRLVGLAKKLQAYTLLEVYLPQPNARKCWLRIPVNPNPAPGIQNELALLAARVQYLIDAATKHQRMTYHKLNDLDARLKEIENGR
jgi:hypothetical protein